MRISTAGVVEKNGRYLVALRKPGTSIGVKWEFPGGKAEEGETPRQALKREFDEELGISIEVCDEIFQGNFSNGPKKYRLLAFSVNLLSSEEEIQLNEHSEYRWVTIKELKELQFPVSDSLIRDYLIRSS